MLGEKPGGCYPHPPTTCLGRSYYRNTGRSGPRTWTHSTSLCVPEGLLGVVDQQRLKSLQVCPSSVSGAELGLKQPLPNMSTTAAKDRDSGPQFLQWGSHVTHTRVPRVHVSTYPCLQPRIRPWSSANGLPQNLGALGFRRYSQSLEGRRPEGLELAPTEQAWKLSPDP